MTRAFNYRSMSPLLLLNPLRWPSATWHTSKGRTVPQPHILKTKENTLYLYCGSICLPISSSVSYTARWLLLSTPNKEKGKIFPWLVIQPIDHKPDHTECVLFSLGRASHPVQKKWKVKEQITSQDISNCCQHISKSEWSSKQALKIMRLQSQF